MIVRQLSGLGDAPAGASTAKLIWWPGDIKALAEQADTEIHALADDFYAALAMFDSGTPQAAALDSFNDFYQEWWKYHEGLGTFSYLSGGTVGTVQNYRLRAAEWRRKLVELGGSPSTPEPSGLPSDKPSSFESTMRWVAGAAIAVAGVYGVTKVLGLVGPLRAAATPVRANPRRRRRRSRR